MTEQNKYNPKVNLLLSSPGFTLIELVLAIALLGFFLAGAFTFNLFGLRTFAAGEMQTSAHQVLRRTADRITDELRYATGDIKLRNHQGYTIPATGNHLFIGSLDTCQSEYCLISQNSSGSRFVLLDPSSINSHTDNFNLAIEFTPAGDSLINFTIKVENIALSSRTQSYDYVISSSVYLNNHEGVVPKADGCGSAGNPCTVIQFATPPPLSPI